MLQVYPLWNPAYCWWFRNPASVDLVSIPLFTGVFTSRRISEPSIVAPSKGNDRFEKRHHFSGALAVSFSLPLATPWQNCIFGGWVGGVDDDVPCMCIHVRCYGAVALLLHTWFMLDGAWGLLKKYLPKQLATKKEHCVNVQMFQKYVWSWCWRQERPKPSVGHGKHVPKIQVTTKVRTSRSKNRRGRQRNPVAGVWTRKEGVDMMHWKFLTFHFAILQHSHHNYNGRNDEISANRANK